MARAKLPPTGAKFSLCESENLESAIRELLAGPDADEVVGALGRRGWFATDGLFPQSEERRERAVAALVAAGLVSRRRGARKAGPAPDSLWSEYAYSGPLLSEAQSSRAELLLRTLDSRIVLTSGYLGRHKGVLIDNEEVLLALDAWLSARGRDTDEVGIRERSYEIFGDEKALTQGDTPRLLFTLLKLDPAMLRYHGTAPNDFPCRYDAVRAGLVVVSENQDMWDSLSRLIERGGFSLLGDPVAGAVFGGGNFARGEGGAALSKFLAHRGIDPERCRYIGDIDPAGIAIQQSVEDLCGIRPWAAMYAEMCASHERRRAAGRPLEPHAEQAGDYDLERFLAELDGRSAREARLALDAGARIPQEAVNLRNMEGMASWMTS